jgi:hypothetical protein
VRTLSVALLIDLLTIERDAARAADIARDMQALAEDLLMSGAYADATSMATALSTRAAVAGAIGRDACRLALHDLAESVAMRETAALIGDVEEADWIAIRDLMVLVGAGCVEALKALVMVEEETRASRRGADLICGFGPAAIPHLGTLVTDSHSSCLKRSPRSASPGPTRASRSSAARCDTARSSGAGSFARSRSAALRH